MVNFGIYKEKRDEKMSQLFKTNGPMWKINPNDDDDDDVAADTSNGVNGNAQKTNQSKRAPSVKDITGISLPYIGAYKKLDNTKQVVALIDDVSNFCVVDTPASLSVSAHRNTTNKLKKKIIDFTPCVLSHFAVGFMHQLR